MTNKQIRVLLIEDNPGDVRLIREMLTEKGAGNFDLVYAERLNKGLKYIAKGGIDIILLDLGLPESQGMNTFLEVFNTVPEVPIVVLTGLDDEELGLRTVEKGAQDYLVKGYVDGNVIVRVIRYAIERKHMEREQRELNQIFLGILSNLSIGVIRIDENGFCTKALGSGFKKWGFNDNQLNGVKIFETFPKLKDKIQKAFKGKKVKFIDRGTYKGKPIYFQKYFFPDEVRGKGLVGIFTDITEFMQAEKRIKASLKEKEVLLKEIHHRVKNNMQIIYSLLNLQSSHIKNKIAQNMLRESQNRIKSMAILHEKLYQSKNLAKIEFSEYIQKLIYSLYHSYGANPDVIKLRINADPVFLDINSAIPCGLIINELATNSLKHAFPQGERGEICLDFHSNKELNSNQIKKEERTNHDFYLTYRDNGIGFPKDLDFRDTESLGLQLVNTLVEQLDGEIELNRRNGTAFKITFAL